MKFRLNFLTHTFPPTGKLFKAYPGKLGYYGQKFSADHIRPNLLNNTVLAGLGFDHRFNISDRLKQRTHGFVQGNFDQTLLFSEGQQFKNYLEEYIRPIKQLSLEERSGWVAGLGHGVLPKTPQHNVHILIETIRKEFA